MADQMIQSTRERTLAFIRGYIRRNKFPPSMKEIGDGVGLSSLSSVTHQLDRLEVEGRITRIPGVPRSIVVREEVDVGTD